MSDKKDWKDRLFDIVPNLASRLSRPQVIALIALTALWITTWLAGKALAQTIPGWLLLLLGSATVVILIWLGLAVWPRIAVVQILRGEEQVIEAIRDCLRGANYVSFVGNLDEMMATQLVDWWPADGDGPRRADIYNTSADFYDLTSTSSRALRLLDAATEAFELRHVLFAHPRCDVLSVTGTDDQKTVLLRWKDTGNGNRGIKIHGTDMRISPSENHMLAQFVDRLSQSQVPWLNASNSRLVGFCKILSKGWTFPILPDPLAGDVLARLSDENLKWWNNEAKSLILDEGRTSNDTLCITWYLHKGSLDDAGNIDSLLRAMRDTARVTIARFVIIDRALYSSDQVYRNIVNNVVTKYFTAPMRDEYSVWYVPSDKVPPVEGISGKDFAYFRFHDGARLAQGSYLEGVGSGRQCVRVWFCNTWRSTNDVERFFELLQSLKKSFSTSLTDFETKIGVPSLSVK